MRLQCAKTSFIEKVHDATDRSWPVSNRQSTIHYAYSLTIMGDSHGNGQLFASRPRASACVIVGLQSKVEDVGSKSQLYSHVSSVEYSSETSHSYTQLPAVGGSGLLGSNGLISSLGIMGGTFSGGTSSPGRNGGDGGMKESPGVRGGACSGGTVGSVSSRLRRGGYGLAGLLGPTEGDGSTDGGVGGVGRGAGLSGLQPGGGHIAHGPELVIGGGHAGTGSRPSMSMLLIGAFLARL